MKNKIPKKLYVTYDGRAIGGATDEAAVYLASPKKHEAIEAAKEYGGVVYAYDMGTNNSLINGKEIFIFTEEEQQ